MNMAFTITGLLLKGYTVDEVVASVISNPLFLSVPPEEVAARSADVLSGLSLAADAFLLINLFS